MFHDCDIKCLKMFKNGMLIHREDYLTRRQRKAKKNYDIRTIGRLGFEFKKNSVTKTESNI